MSLRDALKSEFARSPVQVVGAWVALIAAIQTGVVALLQSANLEAAQILTSNAQGIGSFNLLNAMFVIGYFCTVTITLALGLRFAATKHHVGAFFASVPAVALSNFSTIVIISLFPPRPITKQMFVSAHDLVLYGSVAVMATICGRAVIIHLVVPDKKLPRKRGKVEPSESDENGDGLGYLVLTLFLIFAWGSMVSSGQARLTETLLPEMTHPIQAKASPGGSN